MITDRESRLMRIMTAIVERSGGNPNHDAQGKFASGPGGGGGTGWGKTEVNRRKRKLEADTRDEPAPPKLKKASVRLQAIYDRHPIHETARLHDSGSGETFHVAVVKNAHRFGFEEEPKYHAKTIGSRRGVDDVSGFNDHARAIKNAESTYKRLKREGMKPVSRSLSRKLILSSGRVHKAGSAESILRHCLRQLGWTAAYKRGELTGAQHLELLEAVRQYARAWLRHEAEVFVRHYLEVGERSLTREWVSGPGGFLVWQDDGFIANVGRFFKRAKQFVREAIVAGAMAILGPAPLTGQELGEAEKEAIRQEQYFDRFHEELKHQKPEPPEPIDPTRPQVITIEPPPMTPGEFVARVESYGNAAWQGAQQVNQRVAQGVFQFERRVLGTPITAHCEDCPPLAALGWQPVGSLPPIGSTKCGNRCLCHFRYKEVEGGDEFFQGKKGPIPAPSEVSLLPEDDEIHMIAESPR